MQINAIELFHVALPSRKPIATPLGPRDTLETVIAAVHGDGAVGWGRKQERRKRGHHWFWQTERETGYILL